MIIRMRYACLAAASAALCTLCFAQISNETAPAPAHGTTMTLQAVTPSNIEQSIRAQVSRVRNDMRSLATGIEAYFVDNNRYPISTTNPDESVRKPGKGETNIPSFKGTSYSTGSPFTLTTPIAYITSYFPDPFSENKQTFAYYTVTKDDKQGWILYSPGPDGRFDLDYNAYDPSIPQPSLELLKYSYDPTNGTASLGDIFRVKQ